MNITNLINISILLLICIFYQASATKSYTTLVAPIRKDGATSLYSIILNSHDSYVIDLSAPFSWQHCPSSHKKNTTTISCFTSECIQAQYLLSLLCPLPPTSNPNHPCTCKVTPINPVTRSCSPEKLLTSTNLTIRWKDGANPSYEIASTGMYLSCAPKSLFRFLPREISGVASLSRAPLSLESQFSSNLGIGNKFGLCLPSSSSDKGVVFFGNGPYNLLPPTSFDVSSFLSYTPLIISPRSNDFFIAIKGLSVNGNSIPLSPFEGMKLSTTVPYSTLRSDLYKLLFKFFTEGMKGVPRTKKVKPFDACFNATYIGFNRVGLHVPQIDLEFADGKNWTIYGANSMKMVGDNSACFAFLDGGKTPQHSIEIGSFQMEDNFLLFDLDQSRLGFSSSLLFEKLSCGDFNFTVKV